MLKKLFRTGSRIGFRKKYCEQKLDMKYMAHTHITTSAIVFVISKNSYKKHQSKNKKS